MKATVGAGLALLLAFLLPLSGCATTRPSAAPLADRPALNEFIDQMATRHHFDRARLVELFAKVRVQPSIIEAITRPAESKPWYQYRPIFVTRSRIEEGVKFWDRHANLLDQARQKYGVAPQILVAILGVETRYGTHTGRYRVLDSLSTLAFDYPARAKFFRSELAQFLLLTREEGIDPLSVKGSYAGAMGDPQFISSSYRRYAVDFNGDGKRDLWNSPGDVIGSVANYFRAHGWTPGAPIAVRAKVTGDRYPSLLDSGLEPRMTVSAMRGYGVEPQTPVPGDAQAILLALQDRTGDEYWLGLHNFYVITRYNHSPLYAMAVYQLGEAIRKARGEQGVQAADSTATRP
ncbi:MAG: lytic murein transglycosylase B [Gammaproteobacteria bacterium]